MSGGKSNLLYTLTFKDCVAKEEIESVTLNYYGDRICQVGPELSYLDKMGEAVKVQTYEWCKYYSNSNQWSELDDKASRIGYSSSMLSGSKDFERFSLFINYGILTCLFYVVACAVYLASLILLVIIILLLILVGCQQTDGCGVGIAEKFPEVMQHPAIFVFSLLCCVAVSFFIYMKAGDIGGGNGLLDGNAWIAVFFPQCPPYSPSPKIVTHIQLLAAISLILTVFMLIFTMVKLRQDIANAALSLCNTDQIVPVDAPYEGLAMADMSGDSNHTDHDDGDSNIDAGSCTSTNL